MKNSTTLNSKNIIFLVLVWMLVACSAHKNISKVRGLKFTSYMPMFDDYGKLYRYDSSSRLLYFLDKQSMLYFSHPYHTFEDGSLISVEQKHFWYVFTPGEKYGRIYENDRADSGRRIAHDSIYNHYWPTMKIDSGILENSDKSKLLYQTLDRESGLLNEQYEIKDGDDTVANGIMTLKYSDKLRIREYSFSSLLDSVKKMKLFYIDIKMKPRRFGRKKDKQMDGWEYVAFFEEQPVNDRDEIMYYFNTAQKLDGKEMK